MPTPTANGSNPLQSPHDMIPLLLDQFEVREKLPSNTTPPCLSLGTCYSLTLDRSIFSIFWNGDLEALVTVVAPSPSSCDSCHPRRRSLAVAEYTHTYTHKTVQRMRTDTLMIRGPARKIETKMTVMVRGRLEGRHPCTFLLNLWGIGEGYLRSGS